MIRLGSMPGPQVVMTFDDAISNHSNFVGPLLKEYGFGATFFVTEFEGDGHDRFRTDKRQYMTWEQIRELHFLGFEIGNHTGTHRAVTGLSSEELRHELSMIDLRCEEKGIPRPTSFAYPSGKYDEVAVSVLRERRIARARIVSNRHYVPGMDDVLLMPSYSICDAQRDRFDEALAKVPAGGVTVLTFHGVPDYNHPWVSTEPEQFRRWLDVLREKNCRVIALRDL